MVTKHQLFCMIVLFEIGSSTLFALGIKSRQNAWMVVILTFCIGLALMGLYLLLQSRYPRQGLGEKLTGICGPVLGVLAAVLYAAYFMYVASINLYDFCTLVSVTSLEYTPLPVIMLIIMVPVFYMLCRGVSVLARSSEILLPLVVVSLLLVFVLVLCTGVFHGSFLLPVLPNGIGQLLTSDLVRTVQFPYGETVVFLAFWNAVEPKAHYARTSIAALAFSCVLETVTIVFIICTLGVDYASVSSVPLFKVIRLINIANIITNLNAVGMALIFTGGFFKICIFYFAAVRTLPFANKGNRLFRILAVGTLMCVNTLCIRGFIRHIWSANFVRSPYIHGLFQVAIPLALLLAGLAKEPAAKRKGRSPQTPI